MTARQRNEREFEFWEDLADGGRRYWNTRAGPFRGTQRLVKTVDANERVIQIVQEIYDADGRLIEWQQKYPFDSGPHTRFSER